MFITCPNCNTSFSVTTEQIGHSGKRVQCSCCEYTWYIKPIANANIKPITSYSTRSYSKIPTYLWYILSFILGNITLYIVLLFFREKLGIYLIF